MAQLECDIGCDCGWDLSLDVNAGDGYMVGDAWTSDEPKTCMDYYKEEAVLADRGGGQDVLLMPTQCSVHASKTPVISGVAQEGLCGDWALR